MTPFYPNRKNIIVTFFLLVIALLAGGHVCAQITSPPADFSYSTPNMYAKGSAITSLVPVIDTAGTTKRFGPFFYGPYCVAVDGAGNFYVTDAGFPDIVKLAPNGKQLAHLGRGVFYFPVAIAADADDNLFVTDLADASISKISAVDGSVTPVVTTGLSTPLGLAIDASGNMFVADPDMGAILKIPVGTNTPETFWENPDGPLCVTVGRDGNIYTGDGASNITEISPDGLTVTPIATIPDTGQPQGITTDAAGNVYVTDIYNSRVYQIAPGGVITTTGTGVYGPIGIVSTASGDLYVVDIADQLLKKISGAGGAVAAYTVSPALPAGLVLDPATGVISGTPAVAGVKKSYRVTATNTGGNKAAAVVITITNTDGEIFGYNTPNVFIKNKKINTLTPAQPTAPPVPGRVTSLGSGFDNPYSVAVGTDGTIYVADNFNGVVKKMSADGTGITEIGSGFSSPKAVAVDASGNVYVADDDNVGVYKIDADGVTTTELGSGFSSPQGVAVDAAGYVYVSNDFPGEIKKIDPDGVTVTTISTDVVRPIGLGLDDAGNLYVADVGDETIKKITPDGNTETLPIAGLTGLYDVKVDGDGSLYLINYNTVVKVSPDLATVTKVPAGFASPSGLALDEAGNLYVADTYNNAIKKIQGSGDIITGYAISPALPAGLSFNLANGAIAGRPAFGSPATTYTITAARAIGNLMAQMSIQVNVSDTAKITVCPGDLPYTWNSVDYPAAGTYPGYFTNAPGYDSTLALKLYSDNLAASMQAVSDVTTVCYGKTFKALVTPTGGAPHYQYSIDGSTFQTGRQFTLNAGSYTAIVKDALGCTAVTNTVAVTQPASAFSVTFSSTETSCSASNGSIAAAASGGYGSYLYSIDGGANYVSNNLFNGLGAAIYQVLVSDANNCIIKRNITVKLPHGGCNSFVGGGGSSSSSATAQMLGDLKVNVTPNPADVDFNLQIVSGNSSSKVEIRVLDMQGKTLYHTTGGVYDVYKFGGNFAGGMYVAEVMNGKNVQRVKLVKK